MMMAKTIIIPDSSFTNRRVVVMICSSDLSR